MSCILEPKTITTTRQFTNEDIEIIKVSEDNCFHYHDMPVLELRKAISGVELCLDDYVLAAVPFSYNGVIGISKDYCYLVCDNRFNRNYKYQLISLEWNYE